VSADDLWVKLDAVTSRPIGLFAYQGSTWNPVGLSNGGNTASRPQTGVAGETYFDTDIDVMLVWSGTAWVTQSGSPGDIKFVYLDRDLYTGTAAETEAERLNPGWKVIPNARGMSLVAADHTDTESFGGDQKYQAAGWTFGSKTHTLVEAELPVHNHNMYTSDGANDADSSGGGAGYGVSQSYSSPAIPSGTAVEQSAIMEDIGSDDAHENRPPSFTAYCLIKEGYENTGTDHTGL
jgi:microcystin-dependent protein